MRVTIPRFFVIVVLTACSGGSSTGSGLADEEDNPTTGDGGPRPTSADAGDDGQSTAVLYATIDRELTPTEFATKGATKYSGGYTVVQANSGVKRGVSVGLRFPSASGTVKCGSAGVGFQINDDFETPLDSHDCTITIETLDDRVRGTFAGSTTDGVTQRRLRDGVFDLPLSLR